jgi:hypothetical protein
MAIRTTPVKDKLVELGGNLLTQGIATRIANRPTSLDEANLKRLGELQRMQELGSLGLTDAERAGLEAQFQGQLSSVGRESATRRAQLGASYDTMGGSALEEAALTDRALADARVKATAAITEADMQRQAQQEAEILKRAAVEQTRLDEVAAGRAGLVGTLGQGLVSMFVERRDEEGSLDKDKVLAFATKYKITEGEARKALDVIKNKPELQALLDGAL